MVDHVLGRIAKDATIFSGRLDELLPQWKATEGVDLVQIGIREFKADVPGENGFVFRTMAKFGTLETHLSWGTYAIHLMLDDRDQAAVCGVRDDSGWRRGAPRILR